MTLENLKEQMKTSEVSFKYKKVDGTIREAKGTTNPEIIGKLIEAPAESSKREIKLSENTTRYFDTISGGWRSFRNENYVE